MSSQKKKLASSTDTSQNSNEVSFEIGKFNLPISGFDGYLLHFSGSFRGLCVVGLIVIVLGLITAFTIAA